MRSKLSKIIVEIIEQEKKINPSEIRFKCHYEICHWLVARQPTQSMKQAEPKDINDLFKE
jgi:hypothetical protein